MKRIHIIGPPRSGTTLMLELMINGFNFSHVENREKSAFYLPCKLPDNATLCSKNPRDHKALKDLIDLDEDIYFISMIRDPRDVIVSRHGKKPDLYWANLRQWKEWSRNFKAYRGHARLLEVRYDELASCPDDVQAQLAKQLPFLQRTTKFSEFHQVAQPSKQSLEAMRTVRPVTNSSIGNWTNHLPRVAGQLHIHGPIGDALIEFGFETDNHWLQQLEGMAADLSPGHWPDELADHTNINHQSQTEERLRLYRQARKLPSSQASHQQIHLTREVNATAEKIWSTITDIAQYPNWNPFVTRCDSSLNVGEPIHMKVKLIPGFQLRQQETVFNNNAEELLEYGINLPLKLLSSRRQHKLTKISASITRYESIFELDGLLAPIVRVLLLRRLRAGFIAMTDALCIEAEQKTA